MIIKKYIFNNIDKMIDRNDRGICEWETVKVWMK